MAFKPRFPFFSSTEEDRFHFGAAAAGKKQAPTPVAEPDPPPHTEEPPPAIAATSAGLSSLVIEAVPSSAETTEAREDSEQSPESGALSTAHAAMPEASAAAEIGEPAAAMNTGAPSETLQQPDPAAFQGSLDRVEKNIVEGWAWYGPHCAIAADIDLYIDDQRIVTVKADRFRPDLMEAGIGEGRHAFSAIVPDRFLDEKEHSVEARIGGTGILLSGSPRYAVLEREKHSYEGSLDLAIYPTIQGWAWDARHPERKLAVEIYIDDLLVITVPADQFRADLAEIGKSDGSKSFNVSLPLTLAPGRDYSVSARIAGTDFLLGNTPLPLQFPQRTLSLARDVVEITPSEPSGDAQSALPDLPRVDREKAALIREQLAAKTPPTIVIPIFNAYEAVKRCLESVIEHTTYPCELLLINDASTDERITGLLERTAALPGVTVITHAINQGFTRSANEGLRRAQGDVVLLNSDTQVTPRWLEKLVLTASHNPRIATVTAISDKAGAFSVPQAGENTLPEWLPREALGRLLAGASRQLHPETPTGNGFCMWVRRDAIKEAGLFDEDAFPRGYGEENDFCMRLVKREWLHVVDDSTLVLHERSASFGAEKKSLLRDSHIQLRRRHPEYDGMVKQFSGSAAMAHMRHSAEQALACAVQQPHLAGLPRVLFVLHGAATGGTPQTNEDLMSALSGAFDSFWLDCDLQTITLKHFKNGEYTLLQQWQLPHPLSMLDVNREDYNAVLQHVLVCYQIELVHIRHLYKHSFSLPAIAATLNIPVVMSFHDFYYVCPTINLLDETQRYCAGTCTAGKGECAIPFAEPLLPPLKHEWVHSWRDRARAMFEHVDHFVTTSQDARELYCNIFPQLRGKNFDVIEHGRDFERQEHYNATPQAGEVIRILIPGQLTVHKGADFIARLIEEDRKQQTQRLEFHFLGNLPPRYQHLGIWHGTYARKDFPIRVRDVAPHFIGIFSIWAETYCHTLSEAWACGVPVLASNLGALKERIGQHGGGWTLDITDPEAAYRDILRIAGAPDQYAAQASAARIDNLRSTEHMGHDYAAIYKNALLKRRVLNSSAAHVARIGVIPAVTAEKGESWRAHLRITQWLQHARISSSTQAIRLDPQLLAAGAWHGKLDAVMTQPGALDAAEADALLAYCARSGAALIYDMTGSPRMELPPHEAAILAAATQRITSDAVLPDDPGAFVLPLALDETLWHKPLQAYHSPSAFQWQSGSTFNVAYFAWHHDPQALALLEPVFEKLHRELRMHMRLHVIDIAGGIAEQDWFTRIAVPPGLNHYPTLVSWLRSETYRWHFAVAPISESPGSTERLAVSHLHLAALGLPACYSAVPDAGAWITHGENGMLTGNGAEAWCDSLMEIATAPEHMRQIAQNAKERVMQRRMLEPHAGAFMTIIQSLLRPGAAAPSSSGAHRDWMAQDRTEHNSTLPSPALAGKKFPKIAANGEQERSLPNKGEPRFFGSKPSGST